MPKNKGSGGKKFKQNKTNHSSATRRELPYKVEAEEEYGMVTKTLGNSRFMVQILNTSNSKELMCTLKKSIRRKMHVEPGVLVLLAIRSYQTDHGDIIYTYDHDEREALISEGHIEEDSVSKYSRSGKLQENEDNFSFGGNRNRAIHNDMQDGSSEEESSQEENDDPKDLDFSIDDI